MFTALLIVGAFIRIPFPVVPMTLQTLFVLLAAMLLGPVPAVISVAVYLLLGLAGLPVFTSGGGIFYIFSPTFGYLLGFIPAVFVVSLLSGPRKSQNLLRSWLAGVTGILVIYICGISYMYLLAAFRRMAVPSLAGLFSLGFIITIAGDIVKSLAAALISVRLRFLRY